MDNYSPELLLWYPLRKEITPKPCYTSKISIRYSKSVLFRMYVYVVRTCIRCSTNVYLGGMKMGWYEKTLVWKARYSWWGFLCTRKCWNSRCRIRGKKVSEICHNGCVAVWRTCRTGRNVILRPCTAAWRSSQCWRTTNYFHFHLFRLMIEFLLPVGGDLLQGRNCLLKALDPPSLNRHEELSVAGNKLPWSGVS